MCIYSICVRFLVETFLSPRKKFAKMIFTIKKYGSFLPKLQQHRMKRIQINKNIQKKVTLSSIILRLKFYDFGPPKNVLYRVWQKSVALVSINIFFKLWYLF